MNLNKNGDLIGSSLEMKLRRAWREVTKHHKVNNDGVMEADIVRAFLAIHDEIVSQLSDESPEPKSEVIEFTFGGYGGTARGSTLIENLPGDVFEVEVGKYASVYNGQYLSEVKIVKNPHDRINDLIDLVHRLSVAVENKFNDEDGSWGNPLFREENFDIRNELLVLKDLK